MRAVPASVGGAASRLRARVRAPQDRYALCPADGFWFRPLYTGGKCPLCGEAIVDGAAPLPLLLRFDRFRLGVAVLALASVGMAALVLVMYFSA